MLHPRDIFRSGTGAASRAIIIAITVFVIVGTLVRQGRRGDPPLLVDPKERHVSQARLSAQTALDHSIKMLFANPSWREGFADVPTANGTYSASLSDAASGARDLPRNYVRIRASSEIGGARREIEALWVDPGGAFRHALAAAVSVDLGHEEESGGGTTIRGAVHANAWDRGGIRIDGASSVYGNVTSVGPVSIGAYGPYAQVVGGVVADRIELGPGGEIRQTQNLAEALEGLDLNEDGDATDFGVSLGAAAVVANRSIRCDGRELRDGEYNARIASGFSAVAIGTGRVGPIVDPHPDFAVFYELVTGTSSYPPLLDHVTAPVLGDGDGHYFASAEAFVDWIRFQQPVWVWCWRCGGEGATGAQPGEPCPTCQATGRDRAIELRGLFYVDAERLDLGSLGENLVICGTLVVAAGNPYSWPEREIDTPGGSAVRARVPAEGDLVIAGENRMHVTIGYRSDESGGRYIWRRIQLRGGADAQALPLPDPADGHAMRDYPTIVAAGRVLIEPRRAGFASSPGDIGDERLTILRGLVYSGDAIEIHGQGGWRGERIVFDEELDRMGDDALDEPVLNIDLNGDGDIFDRVELSGISTVPVIPIGRDRYNIDIDSDGLLRRVEIGADYAGFFRDGGYALPILFYQEGVMLGYRIHACGQTLVTYDGGIAASGIPFAFEVSFGATTLEGVISWKEIPARDN